MSNQWTHSFSVNETHLYKGKFTVYRITSVIFQSEKPSAVSCISSWKRFTEVKALYQGLLKFIKRQRLAIKLPVLSKSDSNQYFNRFHRTVIERRRLWILDLLECIAGEPTLYASEVFTKFLQSGGYTPPLEESSSPDDHTDKLCRESDASEDPSSSSLAEDQISIDNTIQLAECPHRFSSDYMVEATERFNGAVQLEVSDRYQEALESYKDGIEVLMAGIREETDPSRRRLAKEKVDKYLSRSESLHYAINSDTAQLPGQSAKVTRELPLNQLAKYKVIRVLDDNTMSVQDVTTRRFYVIKSIDRTEDWHKGLIGDDVAYMVHLVAYFVTEYLVFLLLQPASGGRLVDYMRAYVAKENEPVCPCEGEKDEAPPPCDSDVDIDELLRCSQQLLNSVQKTLEETAIDEFCDTKPPKEMNVEEAGHIPEDCVRQFAKELVVAVDALHGKGIYLGGHLTLRNLLLGKSGQLLLTYYIFRNYSEARPKYTLLALEGSTEASDWWTVGVVLFEFLTGCCLFDYNPPWMCFELQFPDAPLLSEAARSLLHGLLSEDPEARFRFKNICEHAFFNEIIL